MKATVTTMRYLWAYLRQRKWIFLLFILFGVILCTVYRLYHLEWGPAFYTLIVMLAIGVPVCLIDCYYYCKRIKQVELLKKQAVLHIGELPRPSGVLEQNYQEIIRLLESRCQDTERAARESRERANSYYTLWNHQIKTPISAIRLLAESGGLNRQNVEQELLKIEQYVSMGLEYQRLDQPNDLSFQSHDLEHLVKQVLKKIAPLFIYKNISLRLGNLHAVVLTDEKWLCFILEQVLTNAVKYTAAGSVSLSLDPQAPSTLCIEDTGIGIRPEDLPRVFDWGYTGYNGRLDKRSTGIGLALCRQAAQLLGHRIEITSTPGIGTLVKLDLSRDPLEVE